MISSLNDDRPIRPQVSVPLGRPWHPTRRQTPAGCTSAPSGRGSERRSRAATGGSGRRGVRRYEWIADGKEMMSQDPTLVLQSSLRRAGAVMWKWIGAGAVLIAGCVAAYYNQYMWHFQIMLWLKTQVLQLFGMG